MRWQSLGVTLGPSRKHTHTGSARKSAAEGLMSGRDTATLRASNFILREVLPMWVISP